MTELTWPFIFAVWFSFMAGMVVGFSLMRRK